MFSTAGIGLGAEVVAGFADAHKSAILHGFPDTIDTYGLISGLWTSVFALGAFVGPTVAGILFDAVGFPYGTLFIIVTQLLALLFLAGFFGEFIIRSVRKLVRIKSCCHQNKIDYSCNDNFEL